MSVKSERAWEKLWKVEQLQTKIRQLEEDSGNWEAAYKICAKSEDKLIEENQRLTEALQEIIDFNESEHINVNTRSRKIARKALEER